MILYLCDWEEEGDQIRHEVVEGGEARAECVSELIGDRTRCELARDLRGKAMQQLIQQPQPQR